MCDLGSPQCVPNCPQEVSHTMTNPTKMFQCWVIVDKIGRAVGIDNNSGGYPWNPTHLSGVKFFTSKEQAQEYLEVFKDGYLNNYNLPWTIKRASLLIEEE